MDVEAIAAWWLCAYLAGDMTGENLLAALRDLREQLPACHSDAGPGLSRLEVEVRAAFSGPAPRAAVERAAVRHLGVHPSKTVEVRGAPDWSSSTLRRTPDKEP